MDDSLLVLWVSGGCAAFVAFVAWLADRRRLNRKHIDRVGFMPWTPIFFWSLLAAVLLLGLAARQWAQG